MNNTQQLQHRLLMIADDVKALVEFIKENDLTEAFEKQTKYTDKAIIHISNIEIACDLASDESLSWKLFNKLNKDDSQDMIAKVLKDEKLGNFK